MKYEINPIGKINTPYKNKLEVPRQTIYSEKSEGTIEIYKEYKDGLDGLEQFKYIIVLFYFDRNKGYSLKARPPGLNQKRGVFASRSPHRPNYIGISILRLLDIGGNILKVRDVDMLDCTPIIDIKPYISELDSRQE